MNMNRYLLLLLCLLATACSESDARMSAMMIGGVVPAAAPPSGCAAGTLINETWDTTPGEDLTWVDTGTTPDPDSVGHSFTGGSGEVLYIAADTENEMLYQKYNHTSEVLVSYHRFKFRIEDESLANTETARLFIFNNQDDVYLVKCDVLDTAGQLSLVLTIHGTETGDTTQNISVDTDYTLEFYWNRTAQTWAWKLDDVAIEAAGTTDSTRGGWQYTILGVEGATGAANLINVYYECYGVSTAGWVGN